MEPKSRLGWKWRFVARGGQYFKGPAEQRQNIGIWGPMADWAGSADLLHAGGRYFKGPAEGRQNIGIRGPRPAWAGSGDLLYVGDNI